MAPDTETGTCWACPCGYLAGGDEHACPNCGQPACERGRAGWKLVQQALFLRQYGERAPGAGPYPAETWPDWERRAERYLRMPEADSD